MFAVPLAVVLPNAPLVHPNKRPVHLQLQHLCRIEVPAQLNYLASGVEAVLMGLCALLLLTAMMAPSDEDFPEHSATVVTASDSRQQEIGCLQATIQH